MCNEQKYMIDDNKLKVNLDDLINNIREEVASNRSHFLHLEVSHDAETSRMVNVITNIENLLKIIEYKVYIKRKLSEKLSLLPFNLSSKIEKFTLKLINYILKDQREINLNLILLLKESVELNRQLVEQMALLKNQVNHSNNDSSQKT